MADDELEVQTKRKRRTGKAADETQPLPPIGDGTEERIGEATDEARVEQGPSAVIEPGPGELDQALSGLGAAVEREAGGYDLSEGAHRSAIEQAEDAASNAVLSAPSLVWDARDFLLEQIKRRPRPWGGSSPGEQRDIAAACEHAAQQLVSKIAEAMATNGLPSVRVLLGQIVLGDEIKVAGKVRIQGDEDEDAAVLFLHRAQGKHVMLTLASKDEHQSGERPAPRVPEEEPALPFEAGADEIPDDDSDLVEAAGDPDADTSRPVVVKAQTDPLRTGDLINYGGSIPIRVRINLQTGIVEGQQANSEAWDVDIREATPNELASERNRVADFEAEEETETEEA